MGPAYEWFVDLDEYLEPDGPAPFTAKRNSTALWRSSLVLRGVLDQVRIVAPTDSTVLIEGEMESAIKQFTLPVEPRQPGP
jgi:hypothetical protein